MLVFPGFGFWMARSAKDFRYEPRRALVVVWMLGELVVSLLSGLGAGREEKEEPDRDG